MPDPAANHVPDDMGLPPGIGGTVLTVGTFDGVHRGHRLVLVAARRAFTRDGARAACS